ncbi:hypothetical protein HK097_000350 [Rhizophlyctis rosea]|uniref:SH3 domain-containing protein n=1 Tax=Rhizophlyctis rosea TaxID=64517 RepID=A0AAD5S7I0_9FUNG|nr:hypothetical protein HK097_000350 [Rhizophlyctis rosea]
MALTTAGSIGIAISSALLLLFAIYLLIRTNRSRKAKRIAEISDVESPPRTSTHKRSITLKRTSKLPPYEGPASKSLIQFGNGEDYELQQPRARSASGPGGSRPSSKASSHGGLSLSDVPTRTTSLNSGSENGTAIIMPQLSGTESAVEAYRRRTPDELTLKLGDPLSIYKTYSDGWAMGMNWRTGLSGCFPLVAVYPEAATIFPPSGVDDPPKDILKAPSIESKPHSAPHSYAGIPTNTPLAPPPWKGGRPLHLKEPSPRSSFEALQALLQTSAQAESAIQEEARREVAAEGISQPVDAHAKIKSKKMRVVRTVAN